MLQQAPMTIMNDKVVDKFTDLAAKLDNPPTATQAIRQINQILESSMHESLALIQAERQERAAIELQNISSADKNIKLDQLEQSFIEKSSAIAKKKHEQIALIETTFNTLFSALPKDKKFDPTLISTDIQALNDAVNIIFNPAASIIKRDEKTALTVKKDANGTTQFMKKARFFGHGPTLCTMTKGEGTDGPTLHFTAATSDEDKEFIVETLVQEFPNKKVTLTCSQNYANLNYLATSLMAKGFKPQDIKFNFTDDKTGNIEKRTNYADHKGIKDSALSTKNKEAQDEAAKLAAEKEDLLTAALDPINETDPVFMAASATVTPQTRLDALTTLSQPEQAVKIKSLVATQPATAIEVMAQACANNTPANTAIRTKIDPELTNQSAAGLLATFESYNEQYYGNNLTTTNTQQSISAIQNHILGRHAILYVTGKANYFDGIVKNDLLLNQNQTLAQSITQYTAAETALENAHRPLLAASPALHASFDADSHAALDRILTNNPQKEDHKKTWDALTAIENDSVLATTAKQIKPLIQAHYAAWNNFQAAGNQLTQVATKCASDLQNPQLLPTMNANRLVLATAVVTTQPAKKVAQLLVLANKKNDTATLNLIANKIAEIPPNADHSSPQRQKIVDELLQLEGGEEILKKPIFTDPLKTQANDNAKMKIKAISAIWSNYKPKPDEVLMPGAMASDEATRSLKLLEELVAKPFLSSAEITRVNSFARVDPNNVATSANSLRQLLETKGPELPEQPSTVSTSPSFSPFV